LRPLQLCDETGNVFWFEKNYHGDIVAVYSDAETKLISYKYDAWGGFTTGYHNGGSSTKATVNPFRYRGYYYDTHLSLYYLGSRYYDSQVGRFISADEVGYLGANRDLNSYNLYAYCSNNPITYSDPSGNSVTITALLVGAGIGLVSQLASDLVTSMVEGEYVFSDWTSYAGAALGGAIGAIVPGAEVIGDMVGAAVSTAAGMILTNINSSLTGGDKYHGFEEIFYATANSVMISGVSGLVVRNSDFASKEVSGELLKFAKETTVDFLSGVFPSF